MNRKTEPGESKTPAPETSRLDAIGSRVTELSDLVQKLHISLDNMAKDANEDRGGVAEIEEFTQKLSGLVATLSADVQSLRSSLNSLTASTQGAFAVLASRVERLEEKFDTPEGVSPQASDLDLLKESVKSLHLAVQDNATARKALKERVKTLEERAGAVR